MIYKVITDFGENLETILKYFQKDYNIIFYKNVIYMADKEDTETKKDVKRFASEIIKQDFYLQEINENNLKYEPPQVVEWCKEQFVRLDTLRFEAKQQEELKAMLEFINAIEKNLNELTS